MIREIVKTRKTRRYVDANGRLACALHAPRCTERESTSQRVVDDGEDGAPCATCTEIERLIATGEVPF